MTPKNSIFFVCAYIASISDQFFSRVFFINAYIVYKHTMKPPITAIKARKARKLLIDFVFFVFTRSCYFSFQFKQIFCAFSLFIFIGTVDEFQFQYVALVPNASARALSSFTSQLVQINRPAKKAASGEASQTATASGSSTMEIS